MWAPYIPVDSGAPDAFVAALVAAGVPHELRQHEPARHARHLTAIWGRPLHDAGRATLFFAAGTDPAGEDPGAPTGIPSLAVPPSGDPVLVLVLVPADRKVAAPRLRGLLQASELRVVRGDRGVGRVGWQGLPGEPGALPAVPGLFSAQALLEAELLDLPEVLLTIAPGRSVAMAPSAYADVVGALTARFAGRTRLLPEGGMVRDPA